MAAGHKLTGLWVTGQGWGWLPLHRLERLTLWEVRKQLFGDQQLFLRQKLTEEQLSHGTSAHSFGSVGNKNLFASNMLRYPELPDSEATIQHCRNPSKLQPQEFGLKKCPTKEPGQK